MEKGMKFTILNPHDRLSHSEGRILNEYMAEGSFDDLFELMKELWVQQSSKESGMFIIPASFVENDYIETTEKDRNTGELIKYRSRCAANIDQYYMLPIDVDGGMTLEEAIVKWREYSFILYTSFNHRDGDVDKFRLFIEMEEPVSGDDIRKRKQSLMDWLGDGVDKTTLYLSRGFYLPTWNENNKDDRILFKNDGKKLDVLSFEEKKEIVWDGGKEYSAPTDENRCEIVEKLKKTTIGSYHQWWQMVEAMKQSGFDVADLINVSAFNPLHSSSSLPEKGVELCKSRWNAASGALNDRSMGKLVTLIRTGGHPDFRKKGAKKQTMLDGIKNSEKFKELWK